MLFPFKRGLTRYAYFYRDVRDMLSNSEIAVNFRLTVRQDANAAWTFQRQAAERRRFFHLLAIKILKCPLLIVDTNIQKQSH